MSETEALLQLSFIHNPTLQFESSNPLLHETLVLFLSLLCQSMMSTSKLTCQYFFDIIWGFFHYRLLVLNKSTGDFYSSSVCGLGASGFTASTAVTNRIPDKTDLKTSEDCVSKASDL